MNKERLMKVLLGPVISEKSAVIADASNQVTFKVHRGANKIEIRQAVETLLKTKVLDVKTMNVRGKRRRMGRTMGRKPHWKKAIVRLAPGQNIEFFEGM